MRYRIDQDQLWEFLARQARLVERLPVEAAEAAADGYSDGLDDSEREAVWLAAGIATFIGQAIADEPERFMSRRPSAPPSSEGRRRDDDNGDNGLPDRGREVAALVRAVAGRMGRCRARRRAARGLLGWGDDRRGRTRLEGRAASARSGARQPGRRRAVAGSGAARRGERAQRHARR